PKLTAFASPRGGCRPSLRRLGGRPGWAPKLTSFASPRGGCRPPLRRLGGRPDMCLALLALAAHPRFAVVIAANRDEYHARPALPAAWWDEGWLAGRDLTGGGTWLGVTRKGRWAVITNVREPGQHNPNAPSRG